MAVVDYLYDNWGNEIEIDCLFVELPITYKMTSSTVEEVVKEPMGYIQAPIVHKRSKVFYGFNYEFIGGNISMNFTSVSGKKIIIDEYKLNGNDGLVIFTQSTVWNGNTYILFEGKLNLNTLNRGDYYYSCEVERLSIHSKIESRMDTTLKFMENVDLDDVPIDQPATVGIKLLSRTLSERYENFKTKIEDYEGINYNLPAIPAFVFFNSSEPGVNTVRGYNGGPLGVSYTPDMPYNNSIFAFEANGEYKVSVDVKFNLYGKIDPRWLGGKKDISGYIVETVMILVSGDWDGEGSWLPYLKETFELHPTINVAIPPSQRTRTITTDDINGSIFDQEIEVEVGDRLSVFSTLTIFVEGAMVNKLNSQTTIVTQKHFKVEMTGTSDMVATSHRGMLIKEAIDVAFEKVVGDPSIVKSSFYSLAGGDQLVDGCGANRILIPGFRIRQDEFSIIPQNIELSFSLKNLLSSLDALDCIGMGYEWDADNKKETVRIEPREYFFQDVEVMKLENISGFKEEVAGDFIFNNITVGYEKYNEEDVNSLDESHAYHEYQTPIKSDGKKLDLKSKFICSGYIIETTRRMKYVPKEKQATSYDDDTFLIDVKYEPDTQWPYAEYVPITDEPFSSVTGTLSPQTTYNMMHTPKRMLMAHSKWLRSCLVYKSGSSVIKNTLVKQNKELTSTLDPAWLCSGNDDFRYPLTEAADVIVDALTDSQGIYSPEWVRFNVFLTNTEVRMIINAHRGLDTNGKNYGYLSYVDEDGLDQKGWLYELSYDRVKGEASITLLKKKFP